MLLSGEGRWEKVVTKGNAPRTISSTLVNVQNKKLVGFGGIVSGVAQQSLHFLDLGRWVCGHTRRRCGQCEERVIIHGEGVVSVVLAYSA